MSAVIPDECPKCGRFAKGLYGEAEWYIGPSYRMSRCGSASGDYLEYRCKECGYTFTRPTRDRATVGGEAPR